MSNLDTKKKIAYGDFQTPDTLAKDVCALLKRSGYKPKSILEPTCGVGSFFVSALKTFPKVETGFSFDIDDTYTKVLKKRLQDLPISSKTKVTVADFFSKNWSLELQKLPEPILIIGNPPWVTNSQLGQIKSSNLPDKYNFKKLRGLDAMTGKSNFDISEWMMNQMIEWLQTKKGTMSMLCKTSVARKVLMNAWRNNLNTRGATMHLIDSKLHFDISADACLLTITSSNNAEKECKVYRSLTSIKEIQTIGFRDGFLVADIPSYKKTKHLIDGEQYYEWRSGVKHDSSKVMELEKVSDGVYINGFGNTHELEDTYIFPMLKSSCLANGKPPKKYMLVPQTKVGQDTTFLTKVAPKTWKYLVTHGEILDKRKSSIYKNKPRFSVFGVGNYTFKHWKVAISGFYKELSFSVIGPYQGDNVVFDDTVNFIAIDSKEEAQALAMLLSSENAKYFYRSFIFWDSKRPITVQLLKMLDIDRLAKETGAHALYEKQKRSRQMSLLT